MVLLYDYGSQLVPVFEFYDWKQKKTTMLFELGTWRSKLQFFFFENENYNIYTIIWSILVKITENSLQWWKLEAYASTASFQGRGSV